MLQCALARVGAPARRTARGHCYQWQMHGHRSSGEASRESWDVWRAIRSCCMQNGETFGVCVSPADGSRNSTSQDEPPNVCASSCKSVSTRRRCRSRLLQTTGQECENMVRDGRGRRGRDLRELGRQQPAPCNTPRRCRVLRRSQPQICRKPCANKGQRV